MDKQNYYITTAIPYINAKPHIGHALEYVIADAIHRHQELTGKQVFFASGADENALKNVQAAEKEGLEPARFLDTYAAIFKEFYSLLGAELDEFRRGTDSTFHWPGVQEFWRRVEANGDIYTKRYTGMYCVGCESFKVEKDLVDGLCPDHNRKPEVISEENYFFKLSSYEEQLIDLIESDTLKIYPQERKNEILSFIKSGLEDLSISRSNSRARGIGVPVPGDDAQKMYVWFDALNIYMTAVGYGYNQTLWQQCWPADVHVIGKDIIRFHAVYWPAMLLSAQLPLPKQLLVHGFITSEGKKMSKSIGNVIDPYDIISNYGIDATRYYLLKEIPTQKDGDFSLRRFEELYTADLANGLGNTIQRILTLCSRSALTFPCPNMEISQTVCQHMDTFRTDLALEEIMSRVRDLEKQMNETQPWKLEGQDLKQELTRELQHLRQIIFDLQAFMPTAASKAWEMAKQEQIAKPIPLFPRLD